MTDRDRDRKSWFGFRRSGTAQSRQRQEKERKTRPIPNAPRRRRLMKQPLRSFFACSNSPTLSNTPKPEAFIPATAAEQQTADQPLTPAYSIGMRGLVLKNAEEQCLVHMTSCLAQSWPENSEEAVKENLNTEYQVIKQLQLNVTGASTTH